MPDNPNNKTATELRHDCQESMRIHPAYLDRKHPEHKAVVAQVRGLYEKLGEIEDREAESLPWYLGDD